MHTRHIPKRTLALAVYTVAAAGTLDIRTTTPTSVQFPTLAGDAIKDIGLYSAAEQAAIAAGNFSSPGVYRFDNCLITADGAFKVTDATGLAPSNGFPVASGGTYQTAEDSPEQATNVKVYNPGGGAITVTVLLTRRLF